MPIFSSVFFVSFVTGVGVLLCVFLGVLFYFDRWQFITNIPVRTLRWMGGGPFFGPITV